MTYIFLSYASEDLERVKPLVAAFEGRGWSVWWDRSLVAGSKFDEKIEEALDASRCVVVVWSNNSVTKRWVKAEATEGLEKEVLVPLLIDDIRPPLIFRGSQTARLLNWPEREGELGTVIDGITELLGKPAASRSAEEDIRKRSTKSIAVLPFINMSSDPEQEYFVDGLTEDLIDRLSRHSSLRVIARTSSFYFKDRADDVRDIGRRLGVTHLVEGSVRRSGVKIRISAQLVRTEDGSHEWSAHYDRELDDVFTLQDEITKEVTRQLTDRLIQLPIAYQPKLEAYDEYLRGHAWLIRSSFNAARQARSFFDRAIEADPNYAEAYASAARALIMERFYNFEHVLEPLKLAANYVSKALALDPKLASALLQRARILVEWDFDIQASLDLLREVLDREPNMFEGLSTAIKVYECAGRSDLAEVAARKLIRIDPVSAEGQAWLFFLLLEQERLDEAQDVGEALLELEPDNRAGQSNMVILMARQGRLEESLSYIEEHGMQASVQACSVYALAGRRDEIEKVITDMETRSGRSAMLTICYALLGDINGVLRALKEAIDNHDPLLFNLITHGLDERVNIDGIKLGTIYKGPKVQALLKSINFDQKSLRRLKI